MKEAIESGKLSKLDKRTLTKVRFVLSLFLNLKLNYGKICELAIPIQTLNKYLVTG